MKIARFELTDEARKVIENGVWRPYMGGIYRIVAIEIAQKFNKTNMNEMDDQDATRLALAELWKRAFPNRRLYPQAERLLKRYDKDPNIVQSG